MKFIDVVTHVSGSRQLIRISDIQRIAEVNPDSLLCEISLENGERYNAYHQLKDIKIALVTLITDHSPDPWIVTVENA